MWLWIFWNKRDMVSKIGYVGAVGLGLAILGIIARFLWIDCFFFILNNNNINIAISPLKKGWRSFHRSTKEPSRKICVLTMRSLLDIASESIVLKIFWYKLLFYKKRFVFSLCLIVELSCDFRWAGLDLKGTTLKKFMIFNITNPEVCGNTWNKLY